MAKLVNYLRQHGTLEVVGQCLVDNTGMAALARKAGFTVSSSDEGTMAMHLPLR